MQFAGIPFFSSLSSKLFKNFSSSSCPFSIENSAGLSPTTTSLSTILNTLYKLPLFNVETVTESTRGSDVHTKNIIAIIQKRFGLLTISFSAKKDVDGNLLFPNFIQFFFLKRSPVCPFLIASMGFIFFTLLVQPKQNIRITKTTITTQNIFIKIEF